MTEPPPKKQQIHSKSDKNTISMNDLEIKQKKALLYELKKKLLKYDNFEELPIEQLENLCENIYFQTYEQASDSEEQIDPQPQDRQERPQPRTNPEMFLSGVSEQCCGKAYMVKLKQVMVIILVILCIVVKNNFPDSTTYDMGDYSIYQTRYHRTLFATKLPEKKEQEVLAFMEKWMGADIHDDKVKIYLPKAMEKAHKKEQRELTYQSCIDSFSLVCIDHRLTLYGSMNLELQDWIMDGFMGNQGIAFQSSTEYILSIVLSALKIKKLSAEGKATGLVTLIQNQKLNILEMTSIKLSLIQNQCQQFVEIIKINNEEYDKLTQFELVVVSQQFYANYAFPYKESFTDKYLKTSFLIYMPQGVSTATKVLLKQYMGKRTIQEIRFNYRQKAFYSLQFFSDSDIEQCNAKRFSMFLTKPKEKTSLLQQFTSINKQNEISKRIQAQKQTKNSLSSVTTPSFPINKRSLVLNQHPCIKVNSYHTLPTMSYFDKYAYIDTVTGQKLLVSISNASQYLEKGAISPQLLFFINQNLKSDDVVLFPYQFFRDDLILITIAKSVSNKPNFHCVFINQNHPIVTQNLRMNGALNLVSYAYFNIHELNTLIQFYSQHQFSIFFTTFSFLSRDYQYIYDQKKQKMAIFYWILDKDYINFVKQLARKHKVWAILQRYQKVASQNKCMVYGLMQIKQENIESIDRCWLVVQM